ncbi:MAG: hypothetical protein M3R53_08905 [Candidatus Eremiobacteraeota bacterium]|nr:hypothetical protein [Candidatus Eremiobacteraeota bacterium]
MKRLGLLAFTLCLAPSLAAAQQPPAGPPSGAAVTAPDPQRFAAMQQMHAQMRQLHQQARTQMLAALSPQHRTMVANIVGGLATASNPDPMAAARQIDAFLSPGEKQAVLNVASATRTAMHSAMQAQHAQFEASMTAEQRANMQQHMQQREAAEAAHPKMQDAGTVILHNLAHVGGPGEGMHRQ